MSNQYKYNDGQNKDSKINRIQNYKKSNSNNIKIHDQIMKSIINSLKILIIFLILCNLLDLCSGEVEPKLNYDDLTTVMTKSHIFVGGNGAAAINDLNSIKHNNLNKNNNNNNEHFMNGSTESSSTITNLGFIHAFIASISVILVSELGDKTFFIAAIMAMKYPRLTVFIGAMSALALMTVLSAVFGMAATIIPRVYTYYISTALFAIFGIKMLKEGYYMSPSNAQEELEEVQSDIRKREDELEKEVTATLVQDPESGVIRKTKQRSAAYLASRIFMQAFTMTFLAEWGDRSQLTTIILSAREDVYGVIVGGVLGHSLCTGLAVLGGRIIAQRISVRTVTLVGGVVFLLFAISALFFNPNEEKP